MMKKVYKVLFSTWTMVFLLIFFFVSMALATFVENDYGSIAAKELIYHSVWFELILIVLCTNLVGNLFRYKLFSWKKASIFLFHIAFILMIIGAGITYYIGYEGMLHIREGKSNNVLASSAKSLSIEISDAKKQKLVDYSKRITFTSVTSGEFKKSFKTNGDKFIIKLMKYLTNCEEVIEENPLGSPIISFVMSGDNRRQDFTLKLNETIEYNNYLITFSNEEVEADIRFSFDDSAFYVTPMVNMFKTGMQAGVKPDTLYSGKYNKLEKMKIYQYMGNMLVVQKLYTNAITMPVTVPSGHKKSNRNALLFEISRNKQKKNFYIFEGANSTANHLQFGDYTLKLSYLAKTYSLPFTLKLDDFILDRYPGSNSPSSYASDIVLIDKENNVNMPYKIYMNNVLKYRGYRFFQSSYDKDEKGTILSVNHDYWGTLVTYISYFLLVLGIVVSIFNKNSIFRRKEISFGKTVKVSLIILSIALFSGSGKIFAQEIPVEQYTYIDEDHIELFEQLLVQDNKGRTKPMSTLSSDIIRKITRKEQFMGFKPSQLFLEMMTDFDHWKDVPMIKVSNKELQQKLGILDKYAAFTDIVDYSQENAYKIATFVEEAYAKPTGKRNKFDKEVIKLDERVNIAYTIYKGDFFKIIPVGDTISHKWEAPNTAMQHSHMHAKDSSMIKIVASFYIQSIPAAKTSGNWEKVNEQLKAIIKYQKENASYELPSDSKITVEVFYNNFNVFKKLFPFYGITGVILIVYLIVIIIGSRNLSKYVLQFFTTVLFIGFLAHTLGLALRWYISGHAPMSNGYESMVFISWVTILAGFIFAKKSPFSLSATAVLASLALFVANLSFMDPEITNLVPVLKSYWLTLHVSVITSSYGFLGLGAILGLITMILYVFINEKNKERIHNTVHELTTINYKTLTLGLYFLTIGTFLGAVWANESWGRYWGWDPKETWSLITMMVYTFVLHSKMIPSLRNYYTFNVFSLFGFSSVLMTYFGVNYYLSGLHSYAGGDPVPIPSFVYITVISLIAISILAYNRKYRYQIKD